MKQVLIRRGQATVEDIPAPLVEEGHAVVEVAFSLISTGTEMSEVESSGKSLAQRVLEQPDRVKKLMEHLVRQGVQKTMARVHAQRDTVSAPGYSCSGIILQVGQGVTDLQPGDRVACAGAGIAHHAEIVSVPRNLLVKVPDRCGLKEAASVALGAIALQGVRRADLRLGEYAAVIGLGLLGLLSVQLLKLSGCRVIGLDLDERRVSLAKQLGAEAAFNVPGVELATEIRHLTANQGVDASIITAASNSNAILQQSMEITRKKGRVVVVGAVGLGLNRSPFYEKELDLLISCSYGPGRYDPQYERKGLEYPFAYVRWTESRNMVEYLNLVAEGKVDLNPILEREYELAQAPQAYQELKAAADKPLGVILRYPPRTGTDPAEKLATTTILRPKSEAGKIRVALIGAGSFAREVHLPNLQKLSRLYHIRAVASRSGTSAKTTALQFEADYATTDYQEILKDREIDAVLICTRHHLHAEQALMAVKAGKAVFLEKPMAVTPSELEDLAGLLRQSPVPFMVGFNRRFSPAARLLQQAISQRKNPLVMLYRVNAGYLPGDHWTQNLEGGGRIVGEACHMIDLLHYLVGPQLGAKAEAISLAPKTEHVLSGDNVAAILRFEEGSIATLIYTALGNSQLGKEYVEVFADGKTYVIQDFCSLKCYGATRPTWTADQPDKGHLAELVAFAECVNGKTGWPIALEDLVTVTQLSFSIAPSRVPQPLKSEIAEGADDGEGRTKS